MPRALVAAALIVAAAACSNAPEPAPPAAGAAPRPAADPQHQNVVGPHGDHTPHKGGMVLMNADVHYEVVLVPRRPAPDLVQRRRPQRAAGLGGHRRHADHYPARPARRKC